MKSGKFEAGDRVTVLPMGSSESVETGTVQSGPLRVSLAVGSALSSISSMMYLVKPDVRQADGCDLLLPHGALRLLAQWAPCPGDHRLDPNFPYRSDHWERRVC